MWARFYTGAPPRQRQCVERQHSEESPRTLAKRHGIGQMPDVDGEKDAKLMFKAYPIGFLPIDIPEVQTAEGRLHPLHDMPGLERSPIGLNQIFRSHFLLLHAFSSTNRYPMDRKML